MTKRLKILSLANVAAAVVFLTPAAFSGIAEHTSRGDLRVTLPRADRTAELLQEARSATDMAKLRQLAMALAEMRKFDDQRRAMDAALIERLFGGLWLLAVAAGSALLVNAGAIWWLGRDSGAGKSAL